MIDSSSSASSASLFRPRAGLLCRGIRGDMAGHSQRLITRVEGEGEKSGTYMQIAMARAKTRWKS